MEQVNSIYVKLSLFYMQVMTSARANATHNHGLDKDKLIVGRSQPAYPFY